MTTFLLIRHGQTDAIGRRLVGRAPGIDLNEQGHRQARALVDRLAGVPIDGILSSPVDRAVQTARPLAEARGLEVRIRPELAEVESGDYTGRGFEELRRDPAWETWNAFRSGSRIPGGEAGWEITARAVAALAEPAAQHRGGTLAVFTHGDLVRAAVAWFAGMPLDFIARLRIDPASVTVLRLETRGPLLVRMNDTGPLNELFGADA